MKRLTPGTVTIGVFAILFGLAAAYAARRYLDVPVEVAQPTPPPKTASLVVAKVNLPKYSRLRDQDLEVRQVPPDQVPEGALTSKSRALFRVAKATIMADQPVMDAKLYGVGEVPRLSDSLPKGYRAVTLNVTAASALNGMIQPESKVDITMTVDGDHPDLGGKAVMTVMRDVMVLATSENRFPYGTDGPKKVRNITVAVNPEDANRLILAQQYGDLSVALCGTADDGTTLAAQGDERNLINRNTLLGLSPVPVPAPPVVIVKKAEIWRGGKKVDMTFRSGEILESVNATAVAEGREPMQALPVSTQNSSHQSGEKKPCPSCEKKKAAKAAAEAAKAAAAAKAVPTRAISNPQLPTLAPGTAGQVLEVQVEADQIGSDR